MCKGLDKTLGKEPHCLRKFFSLQKVSPNEKWKRSTTIVWTRRLIREDSFVAKWPLGAGVVFLQANDTRQDAFVYGEKRKKKRFDTAQQETRWKRDVFYFIDISTPTV